MPVKIAKTQAEGQFERDVIGYARRFRQALAAVPRPVTASTATSGATPRRPALSSAATSPDASAAPPRQRRVLLATSACYLVYYTGRQNLGWAIPGTRRARAHRHRDRLDQRRRSDPVRAGQLVSGHFADRAGGRRSSRSAPSPRAPELADELRRGFWTPGDPWALNGYAQSMGFAPASRLIAAWWAPRERGWAFGVFNFAAGFSSVVTFGDGRARARVALVALGAPTSGAPAPPGRGGGLVPRADRPEDLGFLPQADADLRATSHPPGGRTRTPASLGARLRAASRKPRLPPRVARVRLRQLGAPRPPRVGAVALLGPRDGASPGPPGSRWPCRWDGARRLPGVTPSTGSSAATIRA